MPSADVPSPAAVGRLARKAAIDAAWRQWTALGASGGAAPERGTILDPEALVLASAVLAAHERRLDDFLLWWAETGAPLLSVQRTRTLLAAMPEGTGEALSAFAASAVAAGDRRWKRLAGPEGLDARPGKGAERPVLTRPSALVLRLRAGFGVSAKADLVALLLGTDRPATVRALAEASGYTTVAVRVALGEIALAGFGEPTGASPMAYRAADRSAWSALLGHPPPPWGYWAEAYAALLAVAAWGDGAEAGGWSGYVAASKARDVWERHAETFRRPMPDGPSVERVQGEGVLAAFATVVTGFARAVADGR
jgi:hypothetical protein